MGPFRHNHEKPFIPWNNNNNARSRIRTLAVHKMFLYGVAIIFSLLYTPVFGSLGGDGVGLKNSLMQDSKTRDDNHDVKSTSVLSDSSKNTSSHLNLLPKNDARRKHDNDDILETRMGGHGVAEWNGKDVKTLIIPASFEKNYSESVNISSQLIFIYNYTLTNQTTAVRVHVSCQNAGKYHPIMFSARQQEGNLAWSVPLDQSESYSYSAVSRTLCPVSKVHREEMDKQQYIFLQVSSHVPTSLKFRLSARLIQDFQLSHNSPREVSVVTAQPKYYRYSFPDDVDQVMLRVTSKSKTCMIVSVQNIKCPVRDLENNIGFEGKHQTMTTQAALFIQRSDFDDVKAFYIVLLVMSNDEKCSGTFHWYDILPAEEVKDRSKVVKITIKEATTTREYVIATLTAVAILLGFYIVAFFMGFLYTSCKSYKVLDDLTSDERGMLFDTDMLNFASDHLLPPEPQLSTPRGSNPPNQNITTEASNRSFFTAQPAGGAYGSMEQDDDESTDSRPPKEMGPVSHHPPSSSSQSTSVSNSLIETCSLNEEEIDFLTDADSEKDIYRNKKIMYVSDMARKKYSKMKKYYNQYIWNLVSLAIFYALPVVQLVITYQRVLFQTGNEDLCYYNFDCSNPLKSYLSSFNNVFSNIGYVMLGFLFILIVRSRDVLHSRALQKHKDLATKVGIPQHYGIFYAMGFALVMEGVMSGSYHVCPNYSNFQFDTSFMYIIACLCMLRIYQNRHTDISAKSHTSYFTMAFVILIALIGVIYSTNIFWIFYALVHISVTFFLSAQVYFMGRWRFSWSSFKHYILFLIHDCRSRSAPVSPNRFIMLVIGNIINWTFALYGAINHPSDFASYLLAIFIGNLLLYCLFYVIMKLLNGEKINLLVMVVMLICLVLWGISLYFFFQHVTSWQKTPSGSREGNRECILFNFYDSHDVWHFLSAFSLFFSFMILLLLDDDISLKPRTQIPVF